MFQRSTADERMQYRSHRYQN